MTLETDRAIAENLAKLASLLHAQNLILMDVREELAKSNKNTQEYIDNEIKEGIKRDGS